MKNTNATPSWKNGVAYVLCAVALYSILPALYYFKLEQFYDPTWPFNPAFEWLYNLLDVALPMENLLNIVWKDLPAFNTNIWIAAVIGVCAVYNNADKGRLLKKFC